MSLKSHDVVINDDEEDSNGEQNIKINAQGADMNKDNNNVNNINHSSSPSTSSAAPTLSSTTSSSDRTSFANTNGNNRDNVIAVCSQYTQRGTHTQEENKNYVCVTHELPSSSNSSLLSSTPSHSLSKSTKLSESAKSINFTVKSNTSNHSSLQENEGEKGENEVKKEDQCLQWKEELQQLSPQKTISQSINVRKLHEKNEQRKAAEAAMARSDLFQPVILCPLENLGNTCYFNSGVQLLANCAPFVYCCRHSPFLSTPANNNNINSKNNNRNNRRYSNNNNYQTYANEPNSLITRQMGGETVGQAFVRVFAKLLHDMEIGVCNGNNEDNSGLESIAPIYALNALRQVYPMFDGWMQQDCMEMLNAVLATFEEVGGLKINVQVLLKSFKRDAIKLSKSIITTAEKQKAQSMEKEEEMLEREEEQLNYSESIITNDNVKEVQGDGFASYSKNEPLPKLYEEEREEEINVRHVETNNENTYSPIEGDSYTTESHKKKKGKQNKKLQSRSPFESTTTFLKDSTTINKDANKNNNTKEATAQQKKEMKENYLPLAGKYSRHWINMFRTLHKINCDNEELERVVCARNNKIFTNYTAPFYLYNPSCDLFAGYTVSSVECHACHCTSRVVERFNSLLLDLPTHSQRIEFAKQHPEITYYTVDGQPLQLKRRSVTHWWNPLSYIWHFVRWMMDWLLHCTHITHPLTLQECLDIHFAPVLLRGSNAYHCESCGRTSEATKSIYLLSFPEYLLLHMKRFQTGFYFHSKKTDPVLFPVSWTPLSRQEAQSVHLERVRPEILNLASYADKSVKPFIPELPPCLRVNLSVVSSSDGSAATHAPHSARKNTSQSNTTSMEMEEIETHDKEISEECKKLITTYTLEGIVNHHGSFTGGHYTAYTHKHVPRSPTTSSKAKRQSKKVNFNVNGEEEEELEQEEEGKEEEEEEEESVWVYMSDENFSSASQDEIADSEEYVLLYRKQPVVKPAQSFVELRNKARYWLAQGGACGHIHDSPITKETLQDVLNNSNNNNNNKSNVSANTRTVTSRECNEGQRANTKVYISRLWLQRMAFFSDPGPILNDLCYQGVSTCSKNQQKRNKDEDDNDLDTIIDDEDEEDKEYMKCVSEVATLPVGRYYVPIDLSDYVAFYTAYGGNGPVTADEYEQLAKSQSVFVKRKMSKKASS